MTSKIVIVQGVCRCGWHGKVRKYKGRMYCTNSPNRCWKRRRLLHAKYDRADEMRNEKL